VQLLQFDFLDSGLNVSRRQSLQSLKSTFPVSAEYFPGGQGLHPSSVSMPVAEEYVPVGQFVHVDSLEAPVVLLHFPRSHFMHSVLSDLAYVPASQSVQLVPAVVLT
jgi:hypothetical protein